MTTPGKKLGNSFSTFLQDIWNYLFFLFDLREGTDRKGTIEDIKKYIKVRGYNVWILVASAMIASIGLDNNSAAVIIGAMLISPLMSPILGIGLGIGINDFDTLMDAFQNFLIAIVVSIVISALYFALSPIVGEPTPEILARTKPTFLDALVALFGGVAGIVSGSRLEKTNAIPGVAIATALMPPLCTVGYGLANLDIVIFLGALYLFLLNAFIIAFTTYVFVRWLKFPAKEYVDPKNKKKYDYLINFVIVLVIVPSIFILISTVQEARVDNNIKFFVNEKIETTNSRVISKEFISQGQKTEEKFSLRKGAYDFFLRPFIEDTLPKSLNIWVSVQDTISTQEIKVMQTDLNKHFGLKYTTLDVRQISEGDMNEITSLKQNISSMIAQLQDQQKVVEQMEKSLDKVERFDLDTAILQLTNKELRAIYPEIDSIRTNTVEGQAQKIHRMLVPTRFRIDTLPLVDGKRKIDTLILPGGMQVDTLSRKVLIHQFFIQWNKDTEEDAVKAYETRIYPYLRQRFDNKVDSVKIFRD
ncbi:MAG: TIGR00341 family protein [Chitinophagales bacterium]